MLSQKQIQKRQLLDELDNARDQLWSLLDELNDTTEIYPGWTKREFFAHVAGWEAMAFEVFYNHGVQKQPPEYNYTNADDANARFVSVRSAMPVADAKLECEINRFAIKALLEGIDDFDQRMHFPAGIETVAEFVRDAIEHERTSADDVRKVIR